ncbi:MAG TPA: hypothetical protein VGA20_10515 [Gemmatimonadales bacterium]
MTFDTRPTRRDWLACSLLGVGIGTVALGIGGRVAMRGIAMLSGTTPGFSWGGTMTVIFLGAVSGLAGALFFMGVRLLLPRRRVLRGVLFWTFLVLVSLRGLRPVDGQRLLLFMPLVLVYGVTLQALWCRNVRTLRSLVPASRGDAWPVS